MKRLITCVLIALLSLCCVSVLAESESASQAVVLEIQPRDSNYFSYYGTSITPLGNGQLDLTFSCGSVGTASQLGVSAFNVQKWSGDGWVDLTGMLDGDTGSNTSSYSFSRTFNGILGETYRVTCSFACTKTDGTSEYKSYTSRAVENE